MIWFLERGPELIVYEARQASDGHNFELSTIAPLGDEKIEQFTTPTAMVERFVEFQRQLHQRGWHVVPEDKRLDLLL